jgi:hypothetical protein
MTRISLLAITILFVMGSCSGVKSLGLSKEDNNVAKASHSSKNKGVKFIDDISVTPQSSQGTSEKKFVVVRERSKKVNDPAANGYLAGNSIENASDLQLKYSILLNTEVEQVHNAKMYEYIDEWYGTRYCMGGTTKSCVDCSAFVQAFYNSLYGIELPRTAREQCRYAKKISRTDLTEGDLLFFNTTGGVSHVGVYLQNNKFVHASSSGGVTISDMFEPYWVKRLISVGRIDKVHP